MDKVIKKLLNDEKNNIEFLSNCIKNNFDAIEKKIIGISSKIDNIRKIIDAIYEKRVIKLELSHIDIQNIEDNIIQFFTFNYKDTNRFLLFYTSKLYEGDLKFSQEEEFKKQLGNELKDINVIIDKTDVIISPAYEQENNFLFKIEHPTLENVFFSIVKFSPKGYKFYFFYDVFSDIFENNFDSLFSRAHLLKQELLKYRNFYNKENISNAILIKAFQNKIVELKKVNAVQNNYFKRSFLALDRLKAFVNNKNEILSLNSMEEEYSTLVDILQKLEIDYNKNIRDLYQRLRKKAYYIKEILDNYNQNRELIEKNIELFKNQMKSERLLSQQNMQKELKDIQQKIAKLEAILQKEDFGYENISIFQNDIPSISKIGIIQERIEDLEKIIYSNKGGILGKIKEKITSYGKELQLEKDKLKEAQNIMKKELNDLKTALMEEIKDKENNSDKLLQMKLSSIQKALDIEKDKLKNLKNTFDINMKSMEDDYQELKKEFMNEIKELYEILDKNYVEFQKVSKEAENKENRQYMEFFNDIKQSDVNFVKLFSEIEVLYNLKECKRDFLPQKIKNFLKDVKQEKSEIEKNLDVKTAYNEKLYSNFNNILEKVKDFTSPNSISKAIIDSIEERFVKDLKLIY